MFLARPVVTLGMEQEQLKKIEEKVQCWIADKQHRRCVKVAICAANAVVLLGLTAGLAILWINELHRANRKIETK